MLKKMKILQLQNHYNVSASDLAEQIIKALPPDQFETTTAFLNGKPASDDALSKADKTIFFDFKGAQLKGFRRFFSARKIKKVIEQEQFHLVIGHRFKSIDILLKSLKGSAIPAIGLTHGIGDYDRPYRQKTISRYVASNWRFVGVSKAVRDELIGKQCGFTSENTLFINNAIDIKRVTEIQLSRSEARAELGLDQNRFIFGTIGRLTEAKGHTYLLKAMELLRQQQPECRLAIIGFGELENDIKEEISKRNLQQHVFLLGKKMDAVRYVKAFDAFVLPSLWEGLPLALLEGMSGRLPVIGSDIDMIRPYLEGIGFIHKTKNPEDLARKMQQVLAMIPDERKKIGDKHYKHLIENFAIDEFRESYYQLIKSGCN